MWFPVYHYHLSSSVFLLKNHVLGVRFYSICICKMFAVVKLTLNYYNLKKCATIKSSAICQITEKQSATVTMYILIIYVVITVTIQMSMIECIKEVLVSSWKSLDYIRPRGKRRIKTRTAFGPEASVPTSVVSQHVIYFLSSIHSSIRSLCLWTPPQTVGARGSLCSFTRHSMDIKVSESVCVSVCAWIKAWVVGSPPPETPVLSL